MDCLMVNFYFNRRSKGNTNAFEQKLNSADRVNLGGDLLGLLRKWVVGHLAYPLLSSARRNRRAYSGVRVTFAGGLFYQCEFLEIRILSGQHHRFSLGDHDGVFDMGGDAAVGGGEGPAVAAGADAGLRPVLIMGSTAITSPSCRGLRSAGR